jgi:hypothetical protein
MRATPVSRALIESLPQRAELPLREYLTLVTELVQRALGR